MRHAALRIASASIGFVALLACSSPAGPDGSDAAEVTADVLADVYDAGPPPRLDDFAEPPAEFRPWVRWWWPGDDVTDEELVREVDALAAAFFGGAELQAFDAALDRAAPADVLARRRAFDTPSFWAHVATALARAEERGLRLDVTLGSGWPTGGAHVLPERSMRTLLWNERLVEGPADVEWPLTPRPSAFYQAAVAAEAAGERLVRFLPEHARVLAVLAARVTGGRRDTMALDIRDTLELDAGSLVDVTDRVTDGTLAWTAPAGRWALVALYAMPDGEYVSLTAEDGAFVADHFDVAEVDANLAWLLGDRTGLPAFAGGALRGFFNDSFELKVERFWTDDLLAEFERRRGYDLRPHLPAVLVPGADLYLFEAGRIGRAPEYALGPDDERVRHDYTRTISELFVERFVARSTAWAEARGLVSRVQAYGFELDLLAAAGAAGIPEAEQLFAGGAEAFLRMVSSGAHLYGRPLVAAEAFVWMGRDAMTTPLKMKAAADKLLGSGVNQLVYHGFPYDHPGDYGATGWAPFSSRYGGTSTFSSELGTRSPFWAWLPAVNRYVARAQLLLRQGEPAAELLVYYPWLGFPASLALHEAHTEPLLGGWPGDTEPTMRGLPFAAALQGIFGEPVDDPRSLWLTRIWPILDAATASGYDWDWSNDERLSDARVEDGAIAIGDRRYEALVVYDTERMPAETAAAVAALAEGGAAVVLAGTTPTRDPGYRDFARRDAAVAADFDRTRAGGRVRVQAADEALAPGLAALGAAPGMALAPSGPVRLARRRLPSGATVVFVRNPDAAPAAGTLAAADGCAEARWLDAWSGAVWRAEPDPTGALPFALEAHGSLFLVCGFAPLDEVGAAPDTDPSEALALDDWTLSVERADATGGTATLAPAPLTDWREVTALRDAGGPATYTTDVTLSGVGPQARVVLELGIVHGAAEVRLNGQAAGAALLPPFRVDVTPYVREGANALEVVVVPPLRNHAIALAAAGDARYAQFTGKEELRIAAGLAAVPTLRCRGVTCLSAATARATAAPSSPPSRSAPPRDRTPSP